MPVSLPSDFLIRFDAGEPMDVAPDAGDMLDQQRKFQGIAYSGGIITDHWMGPCAFDLSSTELAPPIPLLLEHDCDDVVGQIEEAQIGADIRVSGILYAGIDPDAEGIADKADVGHAWQMSVGIYPGSMEEYAAGASAIVNGQAMSGPLCVFRGNRIREVSVCAFAADPATSLQIFSAGHPVSAGDFRQFFRAKSMPNPTTPAEFTAEITRLSAEIERIKTSDPDPAKYVPFATFEATNQELQRFRADAAARAVEDLVAPALADGRILPAQESYARKLAAADPEQFAAFIKAAVPSIPNRSQAGNYGDGKKAVSREVFQAWDPDKRRDHIKADGIVTD